MPDFTLSCITGVVPYADSSYRSYVPRTSRPHLVWVCSEAEKTIGEHVFQSSSREKEHTRVGLRQLLTVDAPTGKCLELYTKTSEETVGGLLSHHRERPPSTILSNPVPSSAGISSLLSSAESYGSESPQNELQRGSSIFVSDIHGNIFRAKYLSCDDDGAPPSVRARTEGKEPPRGTWEWSSLVPAACAIPTSLNGLSGGKQEWYETSRGMPGWAGLAWMESTGSSGEKTTLVSLREFYQDARIVDVEVGKVVTMYGTTHPPTGLHTPAAIPSTFIAAEGVLCTLFDTRCPSAVMTWENSISPEEWRNAQALATPSASLVKNRLTSICGVVRDVCATSNPMEIAACVDRALCVYDLRKFSRTFTSSNVLKYNIASITPLREGSCIVCSGIDSELRLVPLSWKETTTETVSSNVNKEKKVGNAESKEKNSSAKVNSNKVEQKLESLSGTFRTRLNDSIRCESTWQGGWVTSVNENGAAAVGISATGELFMAQ